MCLSVWCVGVLSLQREELVVSRFRCVFNSEATRVPPGREDTLLWGTTTFTSTGLTTESDRGTTPQTEGPYWLLPDRRTPLQHRASVHHTEGEGERGAEEEFDMETLPLITLLTHFLLFLSFCINI